MNKSVAVYMVGDAGIFFPGLVALRSIQDNNPDTDFEYFMCFDGHDLTEEMRRALEAYRVRFVDIGELDAYGSVGDLTIMKEQRWPSHVFCNWLFPYWLHDRGYEEALKVDYDILCVGRYHMQDLMPGEATISALKFNVNLLQVGVSKAALAELKIPVVGDSATIPYYNAGVVGINVKRYVAAGTFAFFRYAYLTVQEEAAAVLNAEQVALAIVAYHSDGIKGIPTAYNQRITILPELDNTGAPLLKNIHYLTHNKPWKEPDYRYLDGYVKYGRTGVYIYRDIWHQVAQTIPGYKDYVPAHSPTPLHTIAMYATVLAAYHKK